MEFKRNHVERNLNAVRDNLYPILEDDASAVLEKAKAGLARSVRLHKESVRQGRMERAIHPWGFSIEPSQPLAFRKTTIDGVRLRVDLCTKVYWHVYPGLEPGELNVAMRVWWLDKKEYFREQWDAPRLGHVINARSGRVMLRVHFDRADLGQPGPKYHLQVGGKQHGNELNWFPEALSVPRLVHAPFDLVLASELVAATFYPTVYARVSREPEWRYCVRTTQQHLFPTYLETINRAIEDKVSVLDALWNKV